MSLAERQHQHSNLLLVLLPDMSLQGYQRWLDTCNSGLKAQHLYHQLRIGSTPCGFIQPWYDIVTSQADHVH